MAKPAATPSTAPRKVAASCFLRSSGVTIYSRESMNVLGESERGRSELTFMLVKVGELLDDGDGMPLLFDPYNLNSKPSAPGFRSFVIADYFT